MSFKQHIFVERDLDVINIFRLNRSKVVSDFISVIKDGKKKGFDNFLINLSQLDGIFPNATVPIAGLLDRYKKEGLEFEYEKMPSNLSKTQMTNPQHYSKGTPNILNRVWKFTDHGEVGLIVDAYDAELRREDRFNEGTIKPITWSLNEVMDNVLIHSESDCGYVMGQIHKQSKNIAFTVYDGGQGIYNKFALLSVSNSQCIGCHYNGSERGSN